MADLKDIKAGDFVAVTGSMDNVPTKREVLRTTATQVVISDSLRFNRLGCVIGGYVRLYAEPWTAEHDQWIVDATRLREQKVAFADMLAAFDRATADARQLRYRDRLFDPAQVEDIRTALDKAQTLIIGALERAERSVKGVE